MTTAHVMQGLPASGKSEFARGLYPALRFNMDDAREMVGMTHDRFDRGTERVIFDAMLAGAVSAVKAGRDVVFDSTHLTPSWPREYRKALTPFGVEWAVHSFLDVSVEECIERDVKRAASVGEAVIRRLFSNYEAARKGKWRLTEKWLTGEKYAPTAPFDAELAHRLELPSVYLCDVDGTVALNKSGRSPYDWSRVSEDKPNWPVIDTISEIVRPGVGVVFLSGRDEVCREATEAWLIEQFAWPTVELYMRPKGDMRPDYVVKGELFDKYIRGIYHVVAVFDDRDQVVNFWRDTIRIPCFQVAPGDF